MTVDKTERTKAEPKTIHTRKESLDMRITYKNPMTKQYQREYALYKAICCRIKNVTCRSNAVSTLALYYAELVKENKDTGHVSYEKQIELEDLIENLIKEQLTRNAIYPDGDNITCSVMTLQDRRHIFLFKGDTRTLMIQLRGKKIITKTVCR